MRKAFDTNVPKLKPRLRPAMMAISDATMQSQDEDTNRPIQQQISKISKPAPVHTSNPDSVNAPEPVSAVTESSTPATDENTQPEIYPDDQKIVQFPDTTLNMNDITEYKEDSQYPSTPQIQKTPLKNQTTVSKITQDIQTTDTEDRLSQSTEELKDLAISNQPDLQDTVSYQSTAISPATTKPSLDNGDTRQKRLEEVKRKVAEAVRPEVSIEPVPEDPALAVQSVLELVSDLESQLSRSRDLEKALRLELAESKAELTRMIGEGRTASGRLGQIETQLEEKRKVLEEMFFEMNALEQERNQAVRMVQMLTIKDQGRQLEFDDLGHRYAEIQQALDESKIEEERLTEELDKCITENNRLNALLTEITKERDNLARNAEKLLRERDELTEAKKALEKVHHALAQARARLRE